MWTGCPVCLVRYFTGAEACVSSIVFLRVAETSVPDIGSWTHMFAPPCVFLAQCFQPPIYLFFVYSRH